MHLHYSDVMMGVLASQITSLTIVYSIVYSDSDQRKHQSSASLACVREIHRWIPRTNDQLRGKCFHLMTSSWNMSTKCRPLCSSPIVHVACVSQNRTEIQYLSWCQISRNWWHHKLSLRQSTVPPLAASCHHVPIFSFAYPLPMCCGLVWCAEKYPNSVLA